MRGLIHFLVILTMGLALAFSSALVAFIITGEDAHPIEAAFVGGFVVLTLQVVAAAITRGED